MKLALSTTMAAVMFIAASPTLAVRGFQDGDTKVELISHRLLGAGDDFPGMWEYVYDVVGTVDANSQNHGWTKNVRLRGFDGLQVVNTWEDDGTPGGTTLKQNWAAETQGLMISMAEQLMAWPNFLPDRFPSYWEIDPNTFDYAWVQPDPSQPNYAWAMDNEWHGGNLYPNGDSAWREGFTHADGVEWTNTSLYLSFYGLQGLLQTFRIVHPNAPGTIEWSTYHNDNEEVVGPILGPGAPPPVDGDFDEDGDIDGDDIGLLCANLTGPGNPAGDPKYDLDGDGDADQADMDMLIHDLVEITGGDGTGTEYGDFDLDGDIDTTDLTILATNFGLGTTWTEGNANCDLVIDTTDLTIMATNFGFVASGAIPEPATMSLLALGGLALLRRRSR